MRKKLKYCGMTRQQDVEQAVALGIDAIGLIFYEKSSRYTSMANAQAISVNLPPFVSRVGVFVNAEPDFVREVIAKLSIDYCQFHGDESLEYCQQFNHPYIKAIRVKSKHCIEQAEQDYPSAQALLIDSWVEGVRGGSGEAFNWSLIPKIEKPLILAGGINQDNIKLALAQPCYALDLCSGIEQQPGMKSVQAMKEIANTVWSHYDKLS